MADTVTVRVLTDTSTQVLVHMTAVSDGTGETAVVKLDKSTVVKLASGAEPTSLDLIAVRWAIQGYKAVQLLWDHTVADLAMVLSGNGYEDFLLTHEELGPAAARSLVDPRSPGGTGDVVLTSSGAVSGATYDITCSFAKSA